MKFTHQDVFLHILEYLLTQNLSVDIHHEFDIYFLLLYFSLKNFFQQKKNSQES